jgi:chemotaxis protein MotB
MDTNGLDVTGSRNSEDTSGQRLKQLLKNSYSPAPGIQNASRLSDVRVSISSLFDGTEDYDMLFNNITPRAVPWSIAWADLMMTMFIFFAVLFIFNVSMQKKHAISQNKEIVEIEKVKNVPQGAVDMKSPGDQGIKEIYDLSRQTLSSASSVELVPDKAVRIILKSDLLFDLGKADIKEDARASLEEVATVLRQTKYIVNIVGHTDDLPINTEDFPSNWELSTARASRVARFFINEMNMPGENFYISGHASYQPVKPNDNEIDRAANRRVEIIITKERPYGVNQPTV